MEPHGHILGQEALTALFIGLRNWGRVPTAHPFRKATGKLGRPAQRVLFRGVSEGERGEQGSKGQV